MKRTSFFSGVIFPALLAIAPGCGDDPKCIELQLECRGVCVDTTTSATDCGACGNACGVGESCVASECAATCAPPTTTCGGTCVDTATSAAHCGACDAPCGAGIACVAGACANPLALVQTSLMDRTVDRDLFVLQDLTFALTKLNPTTFAGSRVIDHAVLPDGSIVLVAAQTEDVFELFHVSSRGGTLTRLSGALVVDGDVQPGLTISADGRTILYRADQTVDETIDLYAVAVANPGVTVKVNGTLVAGGDVSRVVAISANGNRAAYIADQDLDDTNEAYTVDLSTATPGASVKISEDLGQSVWDLQMARDGSKVVYRGGFGPFLYAVDPANPGTVEAIFNSDGGEGFVEGYQLVPDGSAVVYTYSSFLNASLWHAPLVTPPFSSARLADGDLGGVRADLVVSADRSQVYFRKTQPAYDTVFKVDVATGTLTRLSYDADEPTQRVADFALSRDGRSLVFRAGADGAEGGFPQPGTDPPSTVERAAPTIHHVDLSTTPPGAPVQLSPPLGKGNDGIGPGYAVTNDGRVLYRADFDQIGFSDLYLSAVATAPTIRRVSPPLDQTSDATDVSLITLF